ncbi:hypothetical protein [Paractinoplanes lichenicola]|uniref:Uncharacterized protein n=1 Tax=Paractinoplanes lichenicola TaxID=2802976 RepID=A0ABS1VZQ6_9ACTN|nr:hypothetical protein [Actinoplanes lichenicola]MBL7259954.1 hypothetical protein [Actinoplanes lichenicola]
MRRTSRVVALIGAGLVAATAAPFGFDETGRVNDTNSQGFATIQNRQWGQDSWAAIDLNTSTARLDEHF